MPAFTGIPTSLFKGNVVGILNSCHSAVTRLSILDKQEEEDLTLLCRLLNFGLNTNDKFGHFFNNVVDKHS